jgi:secreted Zn-dependent insulinase-like peptidase
LWYKKDDKFERPKSIITMKIYTGDCEMSKTIESRVFVKVWTAVLEEFMREFNYMANCANLSLSISPHLDNITFSWDGFNCTIQVYILQSIQKLLDMRETDS